MLAGLVLSSDLRVAGEQVQVFLFLAICGIVDHMALQSRPLIVAHRGYAVDHPENSLDALVAAKRVGVLVVMDVVHPRSLRRTSRKSGQVR